MGNYKLERIRDRARLHTEAFHLFIVVLAPRMAIPGLTLFVSRQSTWKIIIYLVLAHKQEFSPERRFCTLAPDFIQNRQIWTETTCNS